MLEQEMNPAAAKFISSLVKSLQILCNGQVDFDECIELVGHINVKVDKVHKFDYIVDEQVSREGNDSSTTFLSNSYHSSPPRKSSQKTSSSKQSDPKDSFENDIPQPNNTAPISLSTFNDPKRKQDSVMVKLEEDENDDCMVLPASPGDYEAVEDINAQESFSVAGPSTAGSESYEMDYDSQVNQFRQSGNKRKVNEQEQDEIKESKMVGARQCMRDELPSGSFETNRTTQSDFSYACLCCKGIFPNQLEYDQHIGFCANPSVYFQCNSCYLRTDIWTSIVDHVKTHQEAKYFCDFCFAHFKTQSGLRLHKQVKHMDHPSLSCPLCGKIMYSKVNLEGHMNQHNGVKPHNCTYCAKSFSYKQSLKAHEKICPSRRLHVFGKGQLK